MNCLSETLFPEALERAKLLDAHFKATGKPLGPLHGLPVSIKDSFNIVGKDSTIGFAAFIDQPATYDSVLPQALRAAGAVLHVKTNTPTAMMIAETVNNVVGRTSNPRNRLLSSGGSSAASPPSSRSEEAPWVWGLISVSYFTLSSSPSLGRRR